MSCQVEDITEQLETAEVDKALGDILIHHKGDTKLYLITVLDFLKRKSNFFKLGDAKKRVQDAYKEVSGEGEGIKTGFFSSGSSSSKPAAAAAAPKPAAAAPSAPQVRCRSAIPARPAAPGAAARQAAHARLRDRRPRPPPPRPSPLPAAAPPRRPPPSRRHQQRTLRRRRSSSPRA
jgi:hypothetical protein